MRRLLLLPFTVTVLLLPSHSKAATMTYNVSFTASGLVAASGSYTLTFDPTVFYTETTVGLTVNSFSDTFTPPSSTAFFYNPNVVNGFLEFGGTLNGIGGISGATDDYFLDITNFNTTPTFKQIEVSSTTLPNPTGDLIGTVTVTKAVAATPEPPSVMLLGTGLLSVVALARRHHASLVEMYVAHGLSMRWGPSRLTFAGPQADKTCRAR